jgi:hypothetical protein
MQLTMKKKHQKNSWSAGQLSMARTCYHSSIATLVSPAPRQPFFPKSSWLTGILGPTKLENIPSKPIPVSAALAIYTNSAIQQVSTNHLNGKSLKAK